MSQASKKETPVQITCRLDPKLHATLSAIAKRERRSLSSQILLIVEKHLIEFIKSEG